MATIPTAAATAPSASDFECLGRFVGSCSLIEISLHSVLRSWLGIDEWIARALIGEPRSSDLIAHVKFAYEHNKPLGDYERVTKALQRLYEEASFLNDVRSVVAHKPFFSEFDFLKFHNDITAKKKSGTWAYLCTAQQLRNASWFAIEVAARLGEAVSLCPKDPERYVLRCAELESSRQILDLPNRPGPSSLATPKRPNRPQSSLGKSSSKGKKA